MSNQSDLDEIILRLARYANTLTPYKLDVPIDPLTADGLAETKQLILDWHNNQVLAIIGEDEELKIAKSSIERDLEQIPGDFRRVIRNNLRAEQRNKLKESKDE